jgi:hypothetical protein
MLAGDCHSAQHTMRENEVKEEENEADDIDKVEEENADDVTES